MKTPTTLIAMLMGAALAGCSTVEGWFESETRIPTTEIPSTVSAAAMEAVPGLDITGAEKGEHEGMAVYEIEGTDDAGRCEVTIRADGSVVRVERK